MWMGSYDGGLARFSRSSMEDIHNPGPPTKGVEEGYRGQISGARGGDDEGSCWAIFSPLGPI
jgi:hypothetical protein